MDPSVLAELPPEILSLLAAENGGSIPGFNNSSSIVSGMGRSETVQHYQDDINEAII
jgi:hypothetical protein